MTFRKLRIAWSVAWGFVALLLCVLWVRSYSREYTIVYYDGSTVYGVTSRYGNLLPYFYTPNALPSNWFWRSKAIDTQLDKEDQPFHDTPFTWNRYSPDNLKVCVPAYVPFLLCTAFATAPWIANAKRFSLRTLLIAATLVAVVLGLVAWLC
jgi:hypothetical protein